MLNFQKKCKVVNLSFLSILAQFFRKCKGLIHPFSQFAASVVDEEFVYDTEEEDAKDVSESRVCRTYPFGRRRSEVKSP